MIIGCPLLSMPVLMHFASVTPVFRGSVLQRAVDAWVFPKHLGHDAAVLREVRHLFGAAVGREPGILRITQAAHELVNWLVALQALLGLYQSGDALDHEVHEVHLRGP